MARPPRGRRAHDPDRLVRRAVTCSFLAHLATFGPAYAVGVFAGPVRQQFGLSQWEYSLTGGLATAVFLAGSARTGRLADRIGARTPLRAGAALVGAGLLGAAAAPSFAVLLLCYVVVFGVGVSLSFVPSLAAVAHTRPRRLSLAMGVAATGAGAGTFVVGPLAAVLVAQAGWRTALAVVAVGAAGLLLLAAQLADPSPRPPEPAEADLVPQSSDHRHLVALGFVGFGYYVPFVHLVPGLVEGGMTLTRASAFLSALGVAHLVGRFALAGLAQRGDPARWTASAIAAMGAGCVLLAGPALLAGVAPVARPVPWTLTGVILFGAAAGAFVALVPAVASALAGATRAGAQTGRFYAALACGAALGPVAAGRLADVDGGYGTAYASAGVCLVMGSAVLSTTTVRRSPA